MIDNELKNHIIKLHLEQGRTINSLCDEFGVSRYTISRALRRYRQEAAEDAEKAKILADMEELHRLRREVEELQKENDFLKKAAAFFAKETK